MTPFGAQVIRDLPLAQMWHPLLDIVEVLVFENLMSCQWFLWQITRYDLSFEFLDLGSLRLCQDSRLRNHGRVMLPPTTGTSCTAHVRSLGAQIARRRLRQMILLNTVMMLGTVESCEITWRREGKGVIVVSRVRGFVLLRLAIVEARRLLVRSCHGTEVLVRVVATVIEVAAVVPVRLAVSVTFRVLPSMVTPIIIASNIVALRCFMVMSLMSGHISELTKLFSINHHHALVLVMIEVLLVALRRSVLPLSTFTSSGIISATTVLMVVAVTSDFAHIFVLVKLFFNF